MPIRPDSLLFRFDVFSETPVLKGCAYYSRTVDIDDGIATPRPDENPAQPVSIAAGVPGLDLTALLGTLQVGMAARIEQQVTDLAALQALLDAREASIQKLLAQVADLEQAKAEAI